MKDWDNEIYKEKELEDKKASGLCTMCKWKISLDYVNGEWVETCLERPEEAVKKYMFMDLCDRHYEDILKTVQSIARN